MFISKLLLQTLLGYILSFSAFYSHQRTHIHVMSTIVYHILTYFNLSISHYSLKTLTQKLKIRKNEMDFCPRCE